MICGAFSSQVVRAGNATMTSFRLHLAEKNIRTAMRGKTAARRDLPFKKYPGE
jgi:hypothetical protein